MGQTTPFICCGIACTFTNMHAQTHAILGRTLNPSHLSTDSSAPSAQPYIKVVCAVLLPAASHKPQSAVLSAETWPSGSCRPHLITAALPEC